MNNNISRRSYLLNIFRNVRNLFAIIGGISLLCMIIVADSNDFKVVGICMVVFCVSMLISAQIEKYMIVNIVQDDLCLDTLFTWDIFKSNLNITPFELYQYRKWLKINNYADTEEAFELWSETE